MKLNRRNVAPRKLVNEQKQKPNTASGKRRHGELPRRERNAWPSRWKKLRAARKKPGGVLKKQLARARSKKRPASERKPKLLLSWPRRKPPASAPNRKRCCGALRLKPPKSESKKSRHPSSFKKKCNKKPKRSRANSRRSMRRGSSPRKKHAS